LSSRFGIQGLRRLPHPHPASDGDRELAAALGYVTRLAAGNWVTGTGREATALLPLFAQALAPALPRTCRQLHLPMHLHFTALHLTALHCTSLHSTRLHCPPLSTPSHPALALTPPPVYAGRAPRTCQSETPWAPPPSTWLPASAPARGLDQPFVIGFWKTWASHAPMRPNAAQQHLRIGGKSCLCASLLSRTHTHTHTHRRTETAHTHTHRLPGLSMVPHALTDSPRRAPLRHQRPP
jgi:hypothetical protein